VPLAQAESAGLADATINAVVRLRITAVVDERTKSVRDIEGLAGIKRNVQKITERRVV
jgi:hypothetical protein